MKKLSLCMAAILVTIAAGCSSYTVKYDYDPKEDFTSVNTFDFMPTPQTAETNQLTFKRVIAATTEVLEDKGLKQSSDNPDILVAVYTNVKDKVSVQSYGYTYAPYGYYWGGGGYWGTGGISTYEWEEGTLILDLVKADDKQLIWRGGASRALPSSLTPEKTEKIINEAVKKILKNYPPKQKK